MLTRFHFIAIKTNNRKQKNIPGLSYFKGADKTGMAAQKLIPTRCVSKLEYKFEAVILIQGSLFFVCLDYLYREDDEN